MDLMTVREAGERWGITARMATIYCETGRIPGAFKKGNLWLIPGNTEKPIDRRRTHKREPGGCTNNDKLTACDTICDEEDSHDRSNDNLIPVGKCN